MELNINQKCQLVISGDWDVKNYDPETQDKIELLVYWDDYRIYKIETNRSASDKIIWDLEKDGRYKYFQINLSKSVELDLTPESIIKYLESHANSTDYVAKEIFSICKLRNCTIQLEKEAIHNFIHNYKGHSCKKLKDQSNRDILLIAIFVLENLIVQEKYTEATMILESISTCDLLCKSYRSLAQCNCNCNE